MAINKVEYGGNTLIDLTSDSVTPENLLSGVTAHDASGKKITGTFDSDKYLEKTGDASDTTVTFAQATNRANISSKEKLSVIMGKIAKFFADLKTVAFTGKYSDLSGTPGIVSKTANGLCPKYGGTTTKFLRDDGTYAEPTVSVSGLSTLEQVTAAATAGNVTDPVGAGAVNELNSSLQDSSSGESFNFGSLNGVRGFYTNPSRADDSFIPFKVGNEYHNSIIINTYYHYTNNTTITDISYNINGVKKVIPRITANSFSKSYEGINISLHDNILLTVDIGELYGSCTKVISRTKEVLIYNFENILETEIDTANNAPTSITIMF